MAVDLTNQPYYDDYDSSKKYTKVLAQPGRVEQAREFTQIQTMFMDFLKRGMDVFLRDGDIVEGCALTIEGTTAHLSAGKVYIGGIVHPIAPADVEIAGIDEEVIGVKVTETVVTDAQDPTLRDPAVGHDNYQQPGADRLKVELTYAANDPTAITIYRLVDGSLLNIEEKPQIDAFVNLMARRTFDESGNYKIEGLELFSTDVDANYVAINVEKGRASVMGYEVQKGTTSRVLLDKAKDTRAVLSEPKTFVIGTETYKLSNAPVKQLNKVVAIVEVTQTMTRGNIGGGVDFLPKTPVSQIISVVQGGTTYVQGTDYQLSSDGVDWSLPGAEPAIGTQYTVTYRYNKQMVIDTDCKLTQVGSDYFLDFSLAGDNPVNGTTVYVDYDFYLGRIDILTLSKFGEFEVIKGQSNIERLASAPLVDSQTLLPLASIYLAPNSATTTITDLSIKRMSMADIQAVVKRVEDLEYNQALSDLDEEAMEGETPTLLKGIFSDGFISISRGDVTHANFTASLDIVNGELVFAQTENPKNLAIEAVSTTAHKFTNLATAKFTEKAVIEQLSATETMLVNPYQVYLKTGNVQLSPAVDSWVDANKIIIEQTQARTNLVRGWSTGHPWDRSWVTTSVTRKSEVILDEAVAFMRSIVVTVTGKGFLPNSDNIKAVFDGQTVPLNPIGGTLAGTQGGTVKANANGEFQATFAIPPNVRTGTKEIILSNATAASTAQFTSTGRNRTVRDTITRTVTTNVRFDPLAQSFGFDEDRIITSVGVYFASKDPNEPVTIQIRNMENGTPGVDILASKVLNPAEILVSANGTVETKVSFPEPVYLEAGKQYAITVLSTSALHSMYVANLGDKDLVDGKFVAKQPYNVGILFSSSNAVSWTQHHSKDLKFKVYGAEFDTSVDSILTFNPVTGLNADAYVNAIDSLVPQGSSLKWEIKLGTGDWLPTTVYENRDTGAVTNTIQLRAKITPTPFMSPIIAVDSAKLIELVTATSGVYVSKQITLAQAATTIKQVVDLHLPAGCTASVQFSTDDGATWTTASQTSVVPVDIDYSKYTFTTTLGTAKTTFRTRLSLNSSSPTARAKARKFLNIMK
jgi:hypothetical protein